MKKKVLLMGKSGSGKTSMRSIIFANYVAKDTRRLGATIDVEHSHVKFLGNLVLNLWDCGGQEAFMDNYFLNQRDNIFKNVEVLIYVFDVESRDNELKKDFKYYVTCLNAIYEHSPNAQIFCLIHKMDLVAEDQKEKIFTERENELINMSKPIKCVCFKTSIWDETLFGAWSSIVYKLVPNIQKIEHQLKMFAKLMECDEVLLFERATLLILPYAERKKHHDAQRFEKVSNVIKKFKLSCSKLATKFKLMEIKNSKPVLYIDEFTPNTYIMIVSSDPSITSVAVSLNIKNARQRFEKLERLGYGDQASTSTS